MPQAEAMYREIVAKEHNHAAATHLLGRLGYGGGHRNAGEKLIRRAIAPRGEAIKAKYAGRASA